MSRAPLNLPVLAHPFPTRRSSDLILGCAVCHPTLREFDILGSMFDRREQLFHQPFLIARTHIGGSRGVHPFGVDPRAAQHAVDAAAARVGDDDDRGALLARAAGATRTVLERRSEEHTSELQSLMRISYAVFC